jgi:hypothetical protein
MRSGWRWAGAMAGIAVAIGFACGGGHEDQVQSGIGAADGGSSLPDAGSGGLGDAGSDAGGTAPDASVPDAGQPDAGAADAGGLLTIDFPNSPGWDFYGPQQGGPQDVRDVAMDEGGNLWVAGGAEGLFLMRADASGKLSGTFEKFGIADGLHPYGWVNGEVAKAMGVPDGSPADLHPSLSATPVISVAGGPAGMVFVGYDGKRDQNDSTKDCESAWSGDQWKDPTQWGDPAIYKSGDADRVSLTATGISVVHYDIFSGPGVVKNEIKGREKICSVYRMAWDPQTNQIWFGGNHGFAVAKADGPNAPTCNGQLSCNPVTEHSHPAISGCKVDYDYATSQCPRDKTQWLTDLYYGVAVDPVTHDLWMGGSNRTTKFLSATLGGFFNAANAQTELGAPEGMKYRWDLWPDQMPEWDSQRNEIVYVSPSMRSTPGKSWALDDLVSGIVALNDGTAWVSSFAHGMIRIDSSGTRLADATASLASPFVSSLALDPSDGSLWAGMNWGLAISRLNARTATGTANLNYQGETFGNRLANAPVANIQTGKPGDGAARRMLVGFRANAGYAGAVAIYKGM